MTVLCITSTRTLAKDGPLEACDLMPGDSSSIVSRDGFVTGADNVLPLLQRDQSQVHLPL